MHKILRNTYPALPSFLCFILLVCGCINPLHAQNGWDDIRNNDNKAARTHFIATLAQDSTNKTALEGMIYLSEMEGDNLSYKKYVNTLINSHWDESSYELFESTYHIRDEKAFLAKNSISERNKLDIRLDQAYALQQRGEKEKAYREYRKLTNDFQWSVTGPFKNTCGSGYDIAYAPEKKTFMPDGSFNEETGMKLNWVNCQERNPDGSLYFSFYLPNASAGVYYANTFINIPTERTVQIRISRSSPLKLWLDDQLVFAGDKNIHFRYDNEWVQLKIPAGTHRLFAKYAEYNSTDDKTFSLRAKKELKNNDIDYDDLAYADQAEADKDADTDNDNDNDASDYGDISSLLMSQLNASLGISGGELTIRLTDTAGNLYQDITSSFAGSYKPQAYQPALTDKPLIRYYQGRIKASPDDLFAYYALAEAYINAGLSDEAEEFFVKTYRAHRNSVFFKYLASEIYEENGKGEKFYEVLNDIDPDKTPIFSVLYRKLEEKDRTNDEDEWLTALKRLYTVSPSNYSVIMKYIHYYDDKGMMQEKDAFINQTSEKYPVYKDRLKKYLEKERKENNFRSSTAYDDDDDDMSSLRHVHYGRYTDIDNLKSNRHAHKVLHTFDKLIADEPYNVYYRTEKADYLTKKERYGEALTALRQALVINPYSKDIYEGIGDVFKAQDQKDSAVFYYKKAKHFALTSASSMSALDKKLETVQDQKPLKKLFTTKKFEDVLADPTWAVKYKDEESVVLMYTRDLVLDEFNHVQIFQKMMIKILSEAGVNRWTEFNFNFMGNISSAKVIKSNGAEVVPDMDGGYTVFKDLKPGDIIQLEGIYSWQPSGELDNELAMVTFLTFNAPIYYAKYEVAVPQGHYLGYRHHKLADNTQKYNKEGYDFYKWEYTDLHKLEREDATLDDYDLYANIMISTMKDWSKVVDWYNNKTFRRLESSYEIREVLDSIIRPDMTQQQKVEAIYNYLTKDIKYSFVPFLQSGYIPKRCGLTLSSRIGDCKDVATVMVAMLRQVGIESYYTLVKTNMYDHQKYLPSQYFDHVIAGYYLDGKLHFADMTTDFYPHYVLTEADANAYALLIKPGQTELFQLPQDNLDTTKNKVNIHIDGQLNANRSIDLDVKATYPGMAGGDMRERFSMISQSEQKNYLIEKLGKGLFQNVELKNYRFENLKDITASLKAQYNLSATGFCDKVAGLLIFRVPFTTAIQSSQAMQSKVRYNRMNVQAISALEPTTQSVDIHFPKGYQLVELPENFSLSTQYGDYRITYTRIKDGVHVEKYQAFKVQEVPVKEFDAFKDFYFKILDADMTRMAVEKKPGANATASVK